MFSDFFHSFYYCILFIGAFAGLIFIRRVNAPFKWLAVLLTATLASELIAKYFSTVLHVTNSPVYHIFTILEFIMYAIIYHYFFNTKFWTKMIIYSILFLLFAEILNTIYLQPFHTTNTNILILESLLLIFLSLSLFLQLRSNMAYENLLQEGVLWFNCGVLCYYSFSILIWGFHSIKVYELKNPPRIIYSLLLLLNGILYLIFIGTLILEYLKSKHSNRKV